MELEGGWLELLLKRNLRDSSVARVLSVDKEDVVPKGENYSSSLYRVKMRVLLGTGRETTRTLIIKIVPKGDYTSQRLQQWGFFKNEIRMFRDTLPRMERLLEELGPQCEPMWGKCLEYREYDRLVLEDLKGLGFRVANRQVGLDMNHVKLVMNSLGRYHALSLVMKDRGLLDTAGLEESIFLRDQQMMEAFQDQSFSQLAEIIYSDWGPEWFSGRLPPHLRKLYGDFLKGMTGKAIKKLLTVLEPENAKCKVLNHGDSWVTNMMFKYLYDDNTPISLRFIDFQLPFYSSYAYDLTYFLTTSAKVEVLERRSEVLAVYHKSLHETLSWFKLEYPGVPDLQQIEQEMDRFLVFSFVLATCSLAFMMAAPENTMESEDIFTQYETKNTVKFNCAPFKNKVYTAKTQYILKVCHEQGLFN